MQKNTILYVIIAALAGLIAGFLLTNFFNRSEMNALRAQVEQSKTSKPADTKGSEDNTLSPDEIKAKIAEADKNPTNLSFQKDLGIALYRYSAMKQDPALLTEALRILTRANSIDDKDFDVLVALGNAHFDTGYDKDDAASFEKARTIYTKALGQKPDDPDVRTDLGLTYFVQKPPDYDKAAAELLRVSRGNPKHERSLQFLVQIYVKQNKPADAEKTLNQLKSINPSNPAIADLTQQVAAAKGGAK